jgi:hypothetical protein
MPPRYCMGAAPRIPTVMVVDGTLEAIPGAFRLCPRGVRLARVGTCCDERRAQRCRPRRVLEDTAAVANIRWGEDGRQ